MHESEFVAFLALLDDTWSLKGQTLLPGAKAMWFRALAEFPFNEVRTALGAHLRDPKRGQFLPMPADVIAQLERLVADDGRPGVEEAWALSFRAQDEADTIVWTSEASEAFGIAQPILAAGDEVGARMAFKESYIRLVDEARRNRVAPTWTPSLGHDPERRERAIAEAATKGLLDAMRYPSLPAPRGAVALLANSATTTIPEPARRALLELRTWLTTPADELSEDAAAKADTLMAKHDAAAKVARYTVPVPQTPPVRHFTETDKDSE